MIYDYTPIKFDIVIDDKAVVRGQLDMCNRTGKIQDIQIGNELCPISIQYELVKYFTRQIPKDVLDRAVENILPVGRRA